MLFSTDFIYKITHPKHEINKTYTVTLKGIVTSDEVANLENGVDIVLEKDWNGCYNFPTTKPKGYKRTVVWGIFLICIGIGSIYATNKYRKHYAFECDSFLVDENKGIYHLDGYNDDYDEIDDSYDLIRMKGFEIEEKGYTFCASCEIWVEDAEADYESDRYYRR